MRGRQKLKDALAACGAVLKRQKKHVVYGLPNGKSLTVSATPSDDRSELNALADLRHALGREARVAVVNQRRPKSNKPGRASVTGFGRLSPLAEALRSSGVSEAVELTKARETERALRWELEHVNADLHRERHAREALERLWIVRVYRFIVRTL